MNIMQNSKIKIAVVSLVLLFGVINITHAEVSIPTVIWSNPADIIYGVALSDAQLNATSSIDGAFSYSPVSGTVLKAGANQTLSVTFTPKDTTDYSTVTQAVSINVTPATVSVSGITADNKTYDGTTSAVLNTSVAALSGVVGTDIVTLDSSKATGTFADQNVGTGKTVTVSELILAGTDATNYALTTQPITATADINQATATLTLNTADLIQIYDGTGKSVGVTTSPDGLTGVSVFYINSENNPVEAPTDVGTYGVTVTLTNSNYIAATATGTLTINPVSVHFEIETATRTIFKGDIDATPCEAPPGSVTTTINAFCLFADASIPNNTSWGSYGAFVQGIDDVEGDGINTYWLWFLNGESAQVGIDSYILHNGDTILWTLGIQPLKVNVSTITPTVGDAVTVTVKGFDTNAFDFEPVAGATLNGLATTTDANGVATITTTSTNPVNFTVSSPGFLTSATMTITPVAASSGDGGSGGGGGGVNIILKVYSGDTVLFDGPETVKACAESPEVDAPITINGKCAVEQSGLSNTWIWYDFDVDGKKTDGFLDELGGSSSDNVNYIYWGWFSNLNYGSVAFNQHHLSNSEELLLTYNSHPLRISASPTSGTVGDTIIFTAEEKSNFNADWTDMIWTHLSEATVTLGTQSCTTIADGTCPIVLNAAGLLTAIGSKTLYVPSAGVGIEVLAPVSNGGGGGGITIPITFNVPGALTYLSGAQGSDGSFGGSELYTDWTGVALGAANVLDIARTNILSYMSARNTVSSFLTDNERHAMALLTLGQNPYSFYGADYITPIVNSFDGTQFGDPSNVNDDIFALIPLASAGYTASDMIIAKDIMFVVSKQASDGSWDKSPDMTAAAAQALEPFSSVSGVSAALASASTYLANTQGSDGGWGNIFSSSWAAQAMSALGVTWTKNGKTVADYFAAQQAADGAALSSPEILQNRIWATSYAIPAVLQKPWSAIMRSVSKPVVTSSDDGSGSGIITIPATLKVGDANSDGKVDKYDFDILVADWGNAGASPVDLNHDNIVNEYDLALLMADWSLLPSETSEAKIHFRFRASAGNTGFNTFYKTKINT